MPSSNDYEFINNKISTMKEMYVSLRTKTDANVFSALTVKSIYYKNPALNLNEGDYDSIIVDGQYDGGVDFLLSDPNSETSNMIIGQSKYYKNITSDDIINAITKMALFYKDMEQGRYEQVNERVQGRFLSLFSEVGEESKVIFTICTSAPQKGIRRDRLERKFREFFTDTNQYELQVFFGAI